MLLKGDGYKAGDVLMTRISGVASERMVYGEALMDKKY